MSKSLNLRLWRDGLTRTTILKTIFRFSLNLSEIFGHRKLTERITVIPSKVSRSASHNFSNIFTPFLFFFLILLLLTETNKLSNSSGFNKIRDSFRIGRRSRSSFDHFRGSVKKKKKTRIHTRSHAIHERRADEVRGRRVSAPRVEQ